MVASPLVVIFHHDRRADLARPSRPGGERRASACTASAGLRDVFRLPGPVAAPPLRLLGRPDLGGTPYPIRARAREPRPAGQRRCTSTTRGRSEHLYAHFRPAGDGERRRVPVMQDAGADARRAVRAAAVGARGGAAGPARAAAEVWTALWRVARAAGAAERRAGPGTRRSHGDRAHRGEPGRPLTVPGDRPRRGRLAQPPDPAVPRGDRADGRRATSARRRMERARHLLRAIDAVDPGDRRVGRDPRPAGVQQGLPPRAGRLAAGGPERML